jgi:hypothetical protein
VCIDAVILHDNSASACCEALFFTHPQHHMFGLATVLDPDPELLGKCIPSYRFDDCSSSQVKLLITNNAFCIVQRATAQSNTGMFRDYGVAEAPPGFQAGWSDCMYFFSLFLFN